MELENSSDDESFNAEESESDSDAGESDIDDEEI
jgi:hypothetical protein